MNTIKKIFTILIVSFAFINPSYSQDKIFYLDLDKVVTNTKAGKSIIEELEKHFKIVKSQSLVFPKLYSCPSGVLRASSGVNYGIGDKSSPVAAGKSEKIFEIKLLKKSETNVRA